MFWYIILIWSSLKVNHGLNSYAWLCSLVRHLNWAGDGNRSLFQKPINYKQLVNIVGISLQFTSFPVCTWIQLKWTSGRVSNCQQNVTHILSISEVYLYVSLLLLQIPRHFSTHFAYLLNKYMLSTKITLYILTRQCVLIGWFFPWRGFLEW